MFDIKLDLFDPNIIFEPSLDKAKVNNFFDMTTAILDDIYEITNLGRVQLLSLKEERFKLLTFSSQNRSGP